MRTSLISLRGIRVVPELAEAIQRLEGSLVKIGDVRLKVSSSNATDMGKAGREVLLELISSKYSDKECHLILWGCAIPCGFTPLDRYPNLNTETKNVFHYIGQWQPFLSSLLSYGLGEFAWENTCLASLLDVGLARPSNIKVCYIQAQLARLGLYVGNIDGVYSEMVNKGLSTLGMVGKEENEIISLLNDEKAKPPKKNEPLSGFITLPEIPFRASSYGEVSTVQKKNGVELVIEGTGRVVLDLSYKR
jgi:hypothetical protein